ncbi:MAG TPA: mechanosensitive ion channel family protein [Verrucomicrobiae bacterium]|nr:mechanosensitive ion channel family protein [Verrucomicrobiae bacterium]
MTNQLFQLDTLTHAKQKLIDVCIDFGPKVAAALVIMVIGFFVARWVGRVFQGWIGKLELEPPVRELLLRVLRALVFLFFALMAVQQLGFALAPVIAGLGVAGAGVALAMQGVLGNLAAGLTIIFTKPFRVGQYVSMAGVEGQVEAIELFNTKLSHPDLSTVVVPNRKIVGDILHNYGKLRQLDVAVGVAYNTDLNAALAAVNDVLKQNQRVLKVPAPVVVVSLLADSSIQIAVKPWVNVPDYVPAGGEVNKAIAEEFRARSISIPFPQREVRLLNPPAA